MQDVKQGEDQIKKKRRQTSLIANLNKVVIEGNKREVQSVPAEKAVEIDLVNIRIDNV